MTPEEIADRSAIAAVLDDYARAVDTRDWALLQSVFTPDAVLDYTSAGGPRGQRADVLDWLRRMLPGLRLTQHLLTNKHIVVEGDTASARSELFNPLILDAPDQTELLLIGGRYDDRLRRTPEGWRLTERVHTLGWTAGPFPARIPEA